MLNCHFLIVNGSRHCHCMYFIGFERKMLRVVMRVVTFLTIHSYSFCNFIAILLQAFFSLAASLFTKEECYFWHSSQIWKNLVYHITKIHMGASCWCQYGQPTRQQKRRTSSMSFSCAIWDNQFFWIKLHLLWGRAWKWKKKQKITKVFPFSF